MIKTQSIRDTYGDVLVRLGQQNPNIIVLDADLACSTRTAKFAEAFPERFFNVGIAEQNMISTAVGLAAAGKIPFVSAFAVFATGQAWNQIRQSVCYSQQNVKIVSAEEHTITGGLGSVASEVLSVHCPVPLERIGINDCFGISGTAEDLLNYFGLTTGFNK